MQEIEAAIANLDHLFLGVKIADGVQLSSRFQFQDDETLLPGSCCENSLRDPVHRKR